MKEGHHNLSQTIPDDQVATWEAVLEGVEEQLEEWVFNQWFTKIEFCGIRDEAIIVTADEMTRDWVSTYYTNTMLQAAKEYGITDVQWR